MRRWTSSLALVLVALVAACRTTTVTTIRKVPDPISPAAESQDLTEAQVGELRRAVALAESGRAEDARRALSNLPARIPAVRLGRLEVDFLAGERVAEGAAGLARSVPHYEAAWMFALQAGEGETDRAATLALAREWDAATHSAAAHSAAVEAEAALTSEVAARAQRELDAGTPAIAYATASKALDIVPDAAVLRELAVRAALAAKMLKEAAMLVAGLPDDPAATALKAGVAEALGQWSLAAALYEKLPPATPGRCEGLVRARDHVRLNVAPPYLRQALESTALTRRELAALLVWEVGAIDRARASGVTLYDDIVQLPERSDILTVSGAGVMRGDAITRRFFPNRKVRGDEFQRIVGRVAALSDRPEPVWCQAGGEQGCVALPEPLTGESAVSVLRVLLAGKEGQCR